MTLGPKVDFFISYNSADTSWAEWIGWTLEEAGYTSVIQQWDFGVGNNFVVEMQHALERAEHVIAVLSDEYLAANFTHPEWAAAFATDPQGMGRILIPVMVRPCQPVGLLRTIVHIKVYGIDESTAQQRLLDGVLSGRGKPKHKPLFPGTPSTTP